MQLNTHRRPTLKKVARSPLVGGSGRTLPNRSELLMYTKPVTDSIGIYDMVIISGSDQSDWIFTLANHQDVKDILGINNAFYDVSGVPIQMSWTELQTAADSNVYLFAGLRGAVLYSTDQSADEARIMSVLGGLYVPDSSGLDSMLVSEIDGMTITETDATLI